MNIGRFMKKSDKHSFFIFYFLQNTLLPSDIFQPVASLQDNVAQTNKVSY
jgi:hypothetical protein